MPTTRGSIGASAIGTRQAPQLAINNTISKPNVSGSCSLWRVVCPKGCFRPRFSFNVLSPMRERMPSAGGGSARSVAVAMADTTGCRIPLSRPNHPHSRPIAERRRQVRYEPLESPFAWIANQGDQQPTEDQKMLRLGAAKVPLERVEHLIYFAGDACATPHMSRSCVFWDVGCIQNTQERFFFRHFSVTHPSLQSARPSLLSIYFARFCAATNPYKLSEKV